MNKFEKILLTAFFIELFIGGGGRLIDFGFLSFIRQALFILLILTFYPAHHNRKVVHESGG